VGTTKDRIEKGQMSFQVGEKAEWGQERESSRVEKRSVERQG